jgi:murein DD-endopeptidase MepM/ murein hydrolase activator NlpD
MAAARSTRPFDVLRLEFCLLPRRLPRRLLAALTAGLAIAAASPPAAGVEETAGQARAELARIAARLDLAEEREAAAADAIRSLERRLAAAQARQAATRTHAAEFARTAYMTGDAGSDPLVRLIAVGDPSASVEQLEILHHATRSNREVLEELAVLDRDIRQARAGLQSQRLELAAATAELAADGKQMTRLLAEVAAREAAAAERRAAIAARETPERASRSTDRAAATADGGAGAGSSTTGSSSRRSTGGGYHCAVGPANSFTDTWGAPRSGGRRHRGTDVFAPYGSAVYAVSDGVIARTNWGSNSGLAIQLRSVDGNIYFYAHESAVHVRAGQRVAAGQVIGRVGTTGNAAGTSPHVHFEVWVGGGSAINPYSFLRRTCG